jgi:hypothetical protein
MQVLQNSFVRFNVLNLLTILVRAAFDTVIIEIHALVLVGLLNFLHSAKQLGDIHALGVHEFYCRSVFLLFCCMQSQQFWAIAAQCVHRGPGDGRRFVILKQKLMNPLHKKFHFHLEKCNHTTYTCKYRNSGNASLLRKLLVKKV